MSQVADIPLVDLTRQYRRVQGEVDEAVLRVMAGGGYILGPEVNAFEEEMSDYLDVAHGVGVGSGTSALHLIMRALGIGPGDEVLTTDFTFIATADAISACGAKPVFADIDPRTYNLDPGSVTSRLTGRTRAIVVVHYAGQPADLDVIGEIAASAGIHLIEDCAQAHGARYRGRRVGSVGIASAFSFFPTKPLGGAGDGGMVCTDDGELADRVRALRAHGAKRKNRSDVLGVNSRLDEIQAAVLRVKLRYLDDWNDERRRIASEYDKRLHSVGTPFVTEGVDHVYHLYTVRVSHRGELRRSLDDLRIGSGVYYPLPMHLQPCFSGLGYQEGDFPEAGKASSEVLSLPLFIGMTTGEVRRVCAAVNQSTAGPGHATRG